MWSFSVVVGHEFAQDRREVPLVEHDQVVQALSTERPDHPLNDRVRTRRSNGCGDGIDTDASGTPVEVAAIDRIPIVQQMPRLMSPRCRLEQLAPDPRRRSDCSSH